MNGLLHQHSVSQTQICPVNTIKARLPAQQDWLSAAIQMTLGSLGDMVGQVHWEPNLDNTHCGILGSSLKTADTWIHTKTCVDHGNGGCR